MQAASRSWKRKGTDSPVELPYGIQPCWPLAFSPMRPISDFLPLELPGKFILLEATMFVVTCY